MVNLLAPVAFVNEIKQSLAQSVYFGTTVNKLWEDPDFIQALEDLTTDEFQSRADRSLTGRILHNGKELGKMLVVPTVISGAFLGGISQDLDALYDGLKAGLVLGFGAYAATQGKHVWERYFSDDTTPATKRFSLGIKSFISAANYPVVSGYLHAFPYAFGAYMLWMAADKLPDNQFNYQASHFGLAAITGGLTGIIHTLLDVRKAARLRYDLITRANDIAGQREDAVEAVDYATPSDT